jgi:hypothetical protein
MQLSHSDIINIGYSANDAGIAYNTLDILNEVFARQYQQIRFGETSNVIKFFEKEVARLYRVLSNAEDDLIRYNVSKKSSTMENRRNKLPHWKHNNRTSVTTSC